MTRQVIRPFNTSGRASAASPGGPGNDYCQAIRAGDHVYLRGQVGETLDGDFVGAGDPAAQTEQIMRNVKQLLEEAGAELGHIVKMTVYYADIAHRAAVSRVIGEWMRGIPYCPTGIVVAGLARPEWLVEIDVYAVVTDVAKRAARPHDER
jgi:enamine deaminase RidA (YjgF/YER057c/UK114 family)